MHRVSVGLPTSVIYNFHFDSAPQAVIDFTHIREASMGTVVGIIVALLIAGALLVILSTRVIHTASASRWTA